MRIDSSTFWGSLRIGCGLFPGDPSLRAEVIAVIEHMFADRRGIWQVSIIGSQDRAAWYIKVTGPNAFERSYTLERAAGRTTSRGDSAALLVGSHECQPKVHILVNRDAAFTSVL